MTLPVAANKNRDKTERMSEAPSSLSPELVAEAFAKTSERLRTALASGQTVGDDSERVHENVSFESLGLFSLNFPRQSTHLPILRRLFPR